jgi:Zn finger protein HypA/HybF involved in hydrogenase expression
VFQQELKCPLCSLTKLQIVGGMVSCVSCGYKSESNRYMNLLSIQNHASPCPACATRALVDLDKAGLYKQQGPLFVCFSCGKSWLPKEMDYCPECDNPQPRDEFQELIICRSSVGFYVCRSCYNRTCSPK